MERCLLKGGCYGLTVNNKSILIVIEKHIVLRQTPVIILKLGEYPEQQRPFLQTELSPLGDNIQVRR
ncbi:hypothetical protein LH462_05190 [Laribacter hongkongensis]|uniref:Uncharacterized protein n=1 Tax=Laribacter hongkongensis TaxID=168471 RepID=A0ABD4SPC4_9NEIS|nr:hypothetical protein [Laribacter hongkongensis]MCG9024464.1 hypothetical protein [Laribacter hongkongensis]MCG9099180.1 hypothetical protein [Laribacter hongkongensis]MCG9103121.1 hypothetical protein [Laribacter hongkongensis]MCG9111427.1 hypothetical protein [Laribacter hongkongensis]MCG9117354.1 hypothetical protein [Laribacter hongkongensis]